MLEGRMSLLVRPGAKAVNQNILGKGGTSVFQVSSLITEVFSKGPSSFPLHVGELALVFNSEVTMGIGGPCKR